MICMIWWEECGFGWSVCMCVCVCVMERDGHSKGCEEKGLNENRAEISILKLNKNQGVQMAPLLSFLHLQEYCVVNGCSYFAF